MNEIERGADENSLSDLIEKKKKAFDDMSIALRIRRDFAAVEEAREIGASWSEISEALGHKGKAGRIRQAYFYEKRRREKREKEAMSDAKAKTQKESTLFRSENKPKGGRIGPPKPIGRGRLDLGENTPDDEL